MITYEVHVYDSGTIEWHLNGKCHREDGPAVEAVNGYNTWWLNGQYHREDGPAVECVNGYKAWYLNGKKLTEEEFIKRTSKVKEMIMKEVSHVLGYEVKIVKEQ